MSFDSLSKAIFAFNIIIIITFIVSVICMFTLVLIPIGIYLISISLLLMFVNLILCIVALTTKPKNLTKFQMASLIMYLIIFVIFNSLYLIGYKMT